MEGIRLNGTFGIYREAATSTTIDDGGQPVPVKAGNKVFCSLVSSSSDGPIENVIINPWQAGANREAEFFPNPDEVDLTRNLDTYIDYGVGPQACLGKKASGVALAAMLKVVGRLDNLRRAPGPQGQSNPPYRQHHEKRPRKKAMCKI